MTGVNITMMSCKSGQILKRKTTGSTFDKLSKDRRELTELRGMEMRIVNKNYEQSEEK